MPRPDAFRSTQVEMQILRILWELGPSPVREIHRRLEADKGTNYSTTVKMLLGLLPLVTSAKSTRDPRKVVCQRAVMDMPEPGGPVVHWSKRFLLGRVCPAFPWKAGGCSAAHACRRSNGRCG